jgi:signal transduction histidine kinase
MKRKLLFALSVFLLILFGTGLSAMWLLRFTSQSYSSANMEYFQEIQELQSLRYATSRINNHYLPPLMQLENPPAQFTEQTILKTNIERMNQSLAEVKARGHVNKKPAFQRLQEQVASYRQQYDRLLRNRSVLPTMERRTEIIDSISLSTEEISTIAENLVAGLEQSLVATHQELHKSTSQSNLFIAALLVVGLGASILLYFQATHSLVDPIIGLTESVKEIQRGNFELNLPLRKTNDEVSALIPAFNQMAAELRSMRRANADRFLKVDAQNRAILASFPNPIVLLDKRGHIEKVNPRAQELLDALGLLSGLPPNVATKVENAIEAETEFLPEKLDEALLLRIDETEHYYLPRIFKLSTLEAESQGWVLLLTDVTRLRFFDDMKTNLISTISHEIKTPLTGIRMVLHLLLEKNTGDLTETQEEMLDSALNDCERLLKTLRNLLEMSRMDNGSASLQIGEVNCSDMLEESAQLYESMASQKKIRFDREYEENLPPVNADRFRVGEVINNFLSNALKHSPNGGEIVLCVGREGADWVRVAISDEGPGVPEESQNRIFERFYRAPEQNDVEGVGLGLSIAREIIIAHEGRIGLSQNKDGRTKFYFDLPRA